MNYKKICALVLSSVIAITGLAGCSNSEAGKGTEQIENTTSEKHVEQLNIGTLSANDTFSALQQEGAYGRLNYNGMTQLNLWTRDENNEIAPGFFQSWDISEDNTEMILHFNPLGDLYFHNGDAVTIEDVIFTFEYYKNIKKSTWFQKITDIEQVDDTSIKLSFDSNYAFSFLNEVTLSYYILSKDIWEKVDEPDKYIDADAAIGCGPYKLVSIDDDAQVSYYEAVENYPLGEITVDKIALKSYENQSAMLMALINGEIDATFDYSGPIDPTLIPTIENEENINIGESINSAAYHIVFGFNKYPTNDLPFRLAVRKALDYELLCSTIAGGYGEIANEGAVSPVNLGYDESLPKLSRNLEEANKILDEAKYIDINGDGFRELPDGNVMDVSIALQSGNALYTRMAEVIQTNLADVGIKTTIDQQTISNADYTNELRNQGAYEIYIGMTTTGRAQWTGVVNYVADIMSNKKWGTYADPAYMNAYNGMLYAGNYDEYISSFKEAQKINSEQAPVIALAIQKAFYPYRTDKITGFVEYPSWGVINNKTWFSAKAK